eukprot:14953161-Alexandrium_andersonii.AAC.1
MRNAPSAAGGPKQEASGARDTEVNDVASRQRTRNDGVQTRPMRHGPRAVSYTHLRAHETSAHL